MYITKANGRLRLGVVAPNTVLVEDNELEYYNNLSQFPALLSDPPMDDENPFWVLIKNNIRRFLGIDQPKNAQEAEEVMRWHTSAARLRSDINQLHQTHQKIFGLIPGYSALDALIVEDNYTSAAINASIDLFGGRILKGITGPALPIAEKYSFKTIELASKFSNIAAKLKTFNIREFVILKRSSSDKIIIVGEDMVNRVSASVTDFNRIFKSVETFPASKLADDQLAAMKTYYGRNLTKEELKATIMYQENLDWIKSKLSQGYNVIDIGPKIPNTVTSAFYEMERSVIYGK